MQQPPGYVQYDVDGQSLVCQLTKALYGLRQALIAWFDKLKSYLQYVGFVGSKSDASLFIRVTNMARIYVLVYVDNIIIIGNSTQEIDVFVEQLHSEFSLKDIIIFWVLRSLAWLTELFTVST
ncbi:hypothetical protein EPI10_016972 [Gossypium australe]|uniref:Reverse transcriptase Ty1/copia-type domain-containing protein n=1 Tax=Gossypium australe TaxID=47621 RepID=A0A5B6VQK0_9ROSI|nr:hypothetical protein EPI10_016972 [Gossypium australe]